MINIVSKKTDYFSHQKQDLKLFSAFRHFHLASVFVELKELFEKVFSGKEDITFALDRPPPRDSNNYKNMLRGKMNR